MSNKEFKFLNNTVPIEEKDEFAPSFKIRTYQQKLKFMKEREIPQKSIMDVIEHFFLKNEMISNKVKKAISKISYSMKDRIINLDTTNNSRQIIQNRNKLIQLYGWFFFISETAHAKPPLVKKKGQQSKRKKKERIPEETLSKEVYKYKENSIVLKQKLNMRSLYHNKEYFKYFKLINSKNFKQKPIKDVLNHFFNKNKSVPDKEKEAIQKIIYYEKEKVIVLKSLIGDKMYENLIKLVQMYGWYFYITGVPVGESEISIAIDKIEKRFSVDYFKDFTLLEEGDQPSKPRVSLYSIALKPNYNSLILGLGKLNIFLDCGIPETHFKYVKDYVNNLNDLIVDKEERAKEERKAPLLRAMDRRKNLKEINDLLEFDKKDIETTDEKIEQEQEEPIEPKSLKIIPSTPTNPKIDGIFISHSHYDHVSGLKELTKLYPDIPILCSRITLDLFLLRDSNYLKQETHDEIEEIEYRNIIKNVIYVENGEKIEFKDNDCFLSFFHAGHMPGALMLLAKIKDFKFLFTGDYTYWDYTPFSGTRKFLDQISRPIDFLLIDATSAHEEFDSISDQLHSLILFLEQNAEYKNNSLIGADPSSLAITFMLTFWRYFRKLQLKKDYKNRPNIYVDMMVRKNIQVINHRYEYIYGPISKLIRDKANPFNSIKFRWFDWSDKEFLRGKNNIIISHPPDLSYGIIKNIINVIGRNPYNMVYLSGAIHEEPGLSLIEGNKEIMLSETWEMPFRALLLNEFAPQLKLKLHGDKRQLKEMIKALKPREVCFFHQSPKRLVDVANEIKMEFDFIERVSIPPKRDLVILN